MKKFYLSTILLTFATLLFGQIANITTVGNVIPTQASRIDHIIVEPLSQAIIDEDINQNQKDGTFYKVARLMPLSLTVKNSGTWEEAPDGIRIWKLRISSEGSKASNIFFDYFNLPEGTKMYVYSPSDYKSALGPFTKESNLSGLGYSIGEIKGGEIIIEYIVPENVIYSEDDFKIAAYSYTYRGVDELELQAKATGFKGSDACQVNVNCPVGNSWQNQKKGVCRIYLVDNGSAGYCTGSLVNNTSSVKEAYILSAYHCGQNATDSDLNSWRFEFNYESPSCATPSSEPGLNRFTGCSFCSQASINGGSDFLLVKLTNATTTQIKNANLVYNGWRNTNLASQSGVSIHHPSGDIKKISTYSTALTTTTWNGNVGAPSAHWAVRWSSNVSGYGVTEGGSSGSPIFDNDGYIVGTLTGGGSYCNAQTAQDQYGKFSYHWTSNGSATTSQLKPWLDPGGTATTCSFYDPNAQTTYITANFTASITTAFVGQQITFTDLSTSSSTINTRQWNFGDGNTSALQNPTHSYSATGIYTVTLTVTSAAGTNTKTMTAYINVISATACDYLWNIAQGESVVTYLGGTDYTAGHNSTYNFSEFAEYFEIPESMTLSKVIMYVGAASANSSNPRITLKVYDNNNGVPGNVLHSEDINISTFTAGYQKEITLTSPVTVANKFFVGYQIYYLTPRDNFALGMALERGSSSTIASTMFIKYNNNWSNINNLFQDGFNSSLALKAYLCPTPTPTSFSYNFEQCTNFVVDNFYPCTTYDGDGIKTGSYQNSSGASATIPNIPYTGSFIAINSSALGFTPPSTTNWSAHGGSKFGACAWANSSTNPNTATNNDWFILPKILVQGNATFSFWAKSVSSQYTPESFRVMISTTNNTAPGSFTAISPGSGSSPQSVSSVPTTWTKYTYNLGTYDGQNIYLAINCTSKDKYMFAIDDIEVIEGTIPPPVANFTANQTIGCDNLTVRFTNTSTGNPTSYLWDFGDGNTTTEQNPLHTYNTPGTYTVKLTATNNAGGSDTKIETNLIKIGESPTIDETIIIASSQFAADGTITLNATGGLTPYNYSWEHDSELNSNIADNLTTGTYYVTVKEAFNNCISSKSIFVGYVVPPPVADFTANQTIGCNNLTVEFTNTSTTGGSAQYIWNFGDGTNNSTLENPTHVYNSAGTYTVSLTVTNAAGNNTKTETNLIKIGASPTINETITHATTQISADGSITLNITGATGPYNYSWEHDSELNSNVANNLTTGTYTVTVSEAVNSCTNSKSIFVDYLPAANFTASTVIGCNNLNVQFTNTSTGNITGYSWNFGDGNTSTLENPTHTYNSAGTYTVSLTVTNAAGNNTKTEINLIKIVASPTINETITIASSQLAADGTITLNVTGGLTPYNYSWGHDSGLNSNVANNLTTGTYSVTVEESFNSCTSSKSIFVGYVVPPPVAGFSASPINGCNSLTVNFTNLSTGNSVEYLWDFGDGNTSTATSPSHTYNTAGTYTVKLTATNSGGTDSKTETDFIKIGATPIINETVIHTSSQNSADGSITLNITGATEPYNYSWEHDSELNSNVANDLTTGTYAVTVSEAINNCANSKSFLLGSVDIITEKTQEYSIYPIPVRDILNIQFDGNIAEKLEIVNILGKILYETTPNKDKLQLNMSSYPSGMYLIKLRFKDGYRTHKVIRK